VVNRIPLDDAAVLRGAADESLADAPAAGPGPHPLLPALKIAYRSHEFLTKQVQDYSCRVVTQERIDGRLRPVEYIDAKVRHHWVESGQLVHPRAVYLDYVAPQTVAGRQVLWVEGENDGDMIIRRGGRRFNYVTITISPQSETIRRESRYPTTEMGLKTMVRRLIDIGLEDIKYGECDVQFFREAKIDNRACTCIQVTHPHPRPQFNFHVARIYVDNEQPVPLRYEAYDWPLRAGDAPVLTEQYTFQHLKLNVGFSDAEFRRDYAEYDFGQ
jgi:hypothetical protein